MKVSEIQEESILERKLYIGAENFSPVAVNPTKEELVAMGIPATEEPQYVTRVKRDYGDGEQEYEQASIRIFLDNNNEENRIRTQVSFNIVKLHHISKTNKYLVINKYGSSTWLPEAAIGGTLPQNMAWYLNDDVKKAYRGEPGLIDFIKALYNLPYVNQKSEPKTKEKGVAILSEADIQKLFNGDFSDMRKLIAIDAKEQKVGFLLGVREVDGVYKQTLFARQPLKSYVAVTNKTDKLVEEVADAQSNGAYADAIFDLANTKLREFDPEKDSAQADNNIGGSSEDDDDLPF